MAVHFDVSASAINVELIPSSMNLVYLVMESDIETSRVIGVYAHLNDAIFRACEMHQRNDGWSEEYTIDVWVVGGRKVTTYDRSGRVK